MLHRIFGIETEYGISIEGAGTHDLVAETIAVVRSYPGPCVTGWNYRGEDPRRDIRGFTVTHLATNPDDAQFDDPSRPPMPLSEERSDRILANGARLYNDHGHPEYSTPECAKLQDLVAHDCAGERIVWECARRYTETTGHLVRLYKNNTDYHKASYGTHEGYLTLRSVPADTLILALTPFLVTRQIFAGAGKVTAEEGLFQISQRADFISVEAGVDTLHNRPLVNTRDEPHATPSRYRRLHLIVGDANMSRWATAMKVGTTSLVLALVEDGWQPQVRLRNPVSALKHISRDRTLQWIVELEDGRSAYAIDLQRIYLQEAQRRFAGASEDVDWVLSEWDAVLTDLSEDLTAARDRVDWIAKRTLMEQFMEEEGVGWDAPIMESLDLAYHDVDPEEGLYYGLEASGAMRHVVSDNAIEAARSCPPPDTRASIRGLFVRRFPEAVRAVGWNGIAFHNNGEDLLFDMNSLVDGNVASLAAELSEAATLNDWVAIIQQNPSKTEAKEGSGGPGAGNQEPSNAV
ncbi:MAG: proteasome accessory factor PafA2 family protein [Chthonomonadales bacterium]